MKKLIFFIFVFCSIKAQAQWTPVYGKQRFMQGLAIPYTDTSALKNISDTGCIVMGHDSTIYYRYKGWWKKIGGTGSTTDTTSLSNRIDLRVKYTDTASMLSPYAKSSAVALKVNIADTASMLSPYAKSSAVALKVNISDTASMLSPYAKSSAVALKVNIADTASMLSPYAKNSAVALKVNISDTASMLSPYFRKTLPTTPNPYPINTNGNYLVIGSYNAPYTSGRIDVDNSIAAIGTQTGGVFKGLIFSQSDGSAIFSNTGAIQMSPLAGTGNRMVVAGSTGILSTQTIPSGGSGTVTNVATGYGLSGGPITNTGTIVVDTATLTNKYVPYTGATADVNLDTHILNAQSIGVKGTNGNGHVDLRHQASDANATGQTTAIFADANGDFKWKNDGNYYTTLKTSGNAADAIYTFPSTTTTLIGAGDTATMLSPYLRKVDTVSLSTRINTKLNISDTATMLSPYQRANNAVTLTGTQTLSGSKTFTPLTTFSTGISVAPPTGSGAANVGIIVTGSNTNGGTNYVDFLKATNTASGATNPNKYFRLNGTGGFEILSSNYGTNLFTLTDAGALTTAGNVNGASPTEMGYLSGTTSSVQTQISGKAALSQSAYTMLANNTNATANMTAQTFADIAGTYTGTITWSGTAPTTQTINYYQWQQTGKWVHLQLFGYYTNAGSGITTVTFTLPSDCPAPDISMFTSGSQAILYQGLGGLGTSNVSITLTTTCYLRRNTANTGNEIYLAAASANYRRYQVDITYRAQ